MPTCPSDNQAAVDQSSFWSNGDLNWDAHRIGWAIAGGCAAVTVLVSIVTVLKHCRNYTNPAEQRQILRVLYMPPVYAVISFFSYRYFRSYTYYSLIESMYEAVTLSAFLLLLIEYVASTASRHVAEEALVRKDKQSLPIPFCCWRYRPTKAYFMYTVKWSVLQYVLIRPLVSIAGIVCQAYNVLCSSESYNFRFASVYLSIIDFISITIALYGLILFYGLTREELKGRRPLAKFLSIKLIVMFTFYQEFVFSALEGNVIKDTQYWTATNIADGLTALATCIEMIFFSILMMWAYTWKEYVAQDGHNTSIWRPILDSINYADFGVEIWSSLSFFINAVLGRHQASREARGRAIRPNFEEAFGVEGGYRSAPRKI
ncbi:DUF300-domain-containing protein [Stereum hirsutum FP-91666 SS1]|uniref:DUF300-domain-containing protein n=1 Tax=Stereum hirsutum (strain FP-91666) TaxID=721885 RepID=UPI00044498EB|nr:DUF300-domain-containing protein [Stereum hirsutum FP-91666 SS1]EIM84702.1 DUF300-domain-containing protein [Stereum hirsutum FP-91666 SS1]